MVVRTIKIKENAFHELNIRKRAGESYTDVILRVIENNDVHCTKEKKNI